MTTIKIKSDHLDLELEVTPSQDLMKCLLQAVIACLPQFLESFFKCIADGGPSGDQYKPGDRTRCQ